jgi:pyruvate/2-oxoglutarate dehydrogenase complex dihydrolipoamide dehydrogenase (E3) component
LRRSGITIELGSEVESIQLGQGPDAQGLAVSVLTGKGKKKVEVDKVIYPQRKPQVELIYRVGIKTRGLSIDGWSDEDERQGYAIGDAAGEKRPVASAQASLLSV